MTWRSFWSCASELINVPTSCQSRRKAEAGDTRRALMYCPGFRKETWIKSQEKCPVLYHCQWKATKTMAVRHYQCRVLYGGQWGGTKPSPECHADESRPWISQYGTKTATVETKPWLPPELGHDKYTGEQLSPDCLFELVRYTTEEPPRPLSCRDQALTWHGAKSQEFCSSSE